jgi:hypothetical protein
VVNVVSALGRTEAVEQAADGLPADVTAVDALRKDAELAGTTARANAESSRAANSFARVKEGDYAAVTRRGDVFRAQPDRRGF